MANSERRKGPYTIRRDSLAEQYRWKAENIVRFFAHLGMSKKEKIKFLAEELAGAYMHGEDKEKALQVLAGRKS
jgi:hypothetical protein